MERESMLSCGWLLWPSILKVRGIVYYLAYLSYGIVYGVGCFCDWGVLRRGLVRLLGLVRV